MMYVVDFIYRNKLQQQPLRELMREIPGAELLDYSVSRPHILTATRLDSKDIIYIDTYNLYYAILDQIEQPDGIHIQLQAIAKRPG